MPQKLIRLTSKPQDISPEGNVVNSADTECVFSGLFDEDLHIKQNSEIALQSLSVERKSQELRIKKANNKIKFASVLSDSAIPPGSNQTGEITPLETYNKTNDQVLLESITNGMNKVCSAKSVISQMNIQHKAYVDNGNVKIESRVSPYYTLDQGFDPRETNPSFPSFVNNVLGTIEQLKSGTEGGATGIYRETDTLVAPTDPSEAYIFGTTPFIKSTGALRVRFNRLLSPDGEVSGYIGFVKGEGGLLKLQTQALTEADMEYAIRINGHTQPMEVKTFAAESFTTTGVTPINYSVAGDVHNDILEISLAAGKLQGNIIQNNAAGGTGTNIETPLKSANVADGEDLYWFISLMENFNKIVLDFANVSVDPFFAQENTGAGDGLLSTFTANQALSTLTSNLDFFLDYDKDTVLTPVLRLSDDVANFLGWPTNTLKKPSDNNKPFELTGEYVFPQVDAVDGNNNDAVYKLTLGYFYHAPEPFDNDYEADNYIIDTQSFILDSFDSYGKSNEQRRALSGGSRRNILATVPVSEEPIPGTANGIIQYEPTNLNFIRINNRNDIITRQLRFRLLTGRYQNVPIQNMAAMTILIKDP